MMRREKNRKTGEKKIEKKNREEEGGVTSNVKGGDVTKPNVSKSELRGGRGKVVTKTIPPSNKKK